MRNRRITWLVVGLATVGTFTLAGITAGAPIAMVTCLVLLLSIFLVSKTCYILNLRRASITSFWYLTYLAMILFPAFIIYFYQEGLFRDRYLFAVESVLLTVPLGWLFANWLWSFKREEIEQFYQLPIVREIPSTVLLGRCWILLTVCLLLIVAYLLEVRTIPLLFLIKHPGDAAELALLREESFKLLDSPFSHLYYWARQVFYPLLITIVMGAYLELRTRRWFLTLVLAVGTGVGFAALSIAKAPVALIILVGGIFYYVYKHGQPSRKIVATLLILIFLFPVAVVAYASESGSTTTWLVVGAIGYRLFYIPAEVVYYYFEVFPSHIPYLHGRATDKVAKLLGESYFDTPNMVGTYAYPQGLESVSANAAFIADLNADFGMWGVVPGGILAGMIMQSMQVFVLRRKKTVTTLAMFSFLMAVFWFLNSTSIPIVLLSNGGIPALVIGWYFDRPKRAGLALAGA